MYHILKGMWGNKGDHDGEFRRPQGISIDSKGNIYVADCDNHRIQKFNSRREFLHKWGQYGSGNGQFNQPIAIAIDSNDYVYVTERYNTRVQKFDLNGNFIKVIGFGTGSDYLYGTQGIAVESDDDIVVLNGHRISKYSSNGNFIRSWDHLVLVTVSFKHLKVLQLIPMMIYMLQTEAFIVYKSLILKVILLENGDNGLN